MIIKGDAKLFFNISPVENIILLKPKRLAFVDLKIISCYIDLARILEK